MESLASVWYVALLWARGVDVFLCRRRHGAEGNEGFKLRVKPTIITTRMISLVRVVKITLSLRRNRNETACPTNATCKLNIRLQPLHLRPQPLDFFMQGLTMATSMWIGWG